MIFNGGELASYVSLVNYVSAAFADPGTREPLEPLIDESVFVQVEAWKKYKGLIGVASAPASVRRCK